MKKIKLINANVFLKQTEKAIQIIEERGEDYKKTLEASEKLEIAKQFKGEVKNIEEQEAYSRHIKKLEFESRNAGKGEGALAAVPEEHRLKIATNREVEEEELNRELSEQKRMLADLIENTKDDYINLLTNIAALENRMELGTKIDVLLESEFNRHVSLGNPILQANRYSRSLNAEHAQKTLNVSKVLFEKLEVYSSQPNGKSPFKKEASFFDKLLGGRK